MTVLNRQRFVILAALVLAAAAFLFLALHGRAVPVGAIFLSVISLAAAFAVAFLHLRHMALAAVATAAPLPGMFAAGPFAVDHGLDIAGLLAVYGFATVAGAVLCSGIVTVILAGRDGAEAAFVSPPRLLPALGAAVLVAVVLAIGWLFREARGLAFAMSAEMMASAVSVILFIGFGAATLPFSETAITQVNRARERRGRRLGLMTLVVEPRWGMSLSGVALVLAVLGAFGAGSVLAKNGLLAEPAYWLATAVVVFGVVFAISRDGREAVGASLALAVSIALGVWLWGRAVGHVTPLPFLDILAAAAAALLVALDLLDRARRYRAAGDAPLVARLRAIEDDAMPALFGCGGAAAAMAPWIVLHGSLATLAALFALGGGAALVLAPALATALETLLRRRMSVEDLYGRG
ncbi:MAG: hypothetical protein WDN03_13780 [Rhizomicrobium sp.]